MSRIRVGVSSDRQVNEGTWSIGRGTALDPEATVYRLDTGAPEGLDAYWPIGDKILFVLDEPLMPRVGDAAYGYALNSVPLGNRTTSRVSASGAMPASRTELGDVHRHGPASRAASGQAPQEEARGALDLEARIRRHAVRDRGRQRLLGGGEGVEQIQRGLPWHELVVPLHQELEAGCSLALP